MLRRASSKRLNATRAAIQEQTPTESGPSKPSPQGKPVSQTTKRQAPPVLGAYDAQSNNEDNQLEQLVLGGEKELLDRLQGIPSKKLQKKSSFQGITKAKPVWTDADDSNRGVSSESRKKNAKSSNSSSGKFNSQLNRYEEITGNPTWARLRSERPAPDEGDSDDETLFQKTGDYLTGSSFLPKGTIQLKRCTNANNASPAKGKLKCVEFHPSSQVLLTAGQDQRLSLFQVDGKDNNLIQSVFMERFPIFSAHFSMDGREVIMASKHKRFYYYDMISGKLVDVPRIAGIEETAMKNFKLSPDGKLIVFRGKSGAMHLLSAKSKEWICSLKMNGHVSDIAFYKDGSKMVSFGDEGDVYVWDLQTRDCIHRFTDEGCVHGMSIDVSPNSRYLACGSMSGVVNIYDESCLTQRHPKPVKAVMNLTSACTSVQFNPTSEILCAISNQDEKAVKMVHVGSRSTFSNFPERGDAIGIPLCTDFSLNSGYFTLSNSNGRALLYRIKHYSNY